MMRRGLMMGRDRSAARCVDCQQPPKIQSMLLRLPSRSFREIDGWLIVNGGKAMLPPASAATVRDFAADVAADEAAAQRGNQLAGEWRLLQRHSHLTAFAGPAQGR